MPSATQAGRKGTFTPAPSASDVARVERLIKETRRVLGVLDRELDEIRAARESQMAAAENQAESFQNESGKTMMEAAPLPQNVVTVSRELFAAEALKEVVLDPALEKATVDELNAALADAFNHVSGQ